MPLDLQALRPEQGPRNLDHRQHRRSQVRPAECAPKVHPQPNADQRHEVGHANLCCDPLDEAHVALSL